MTDKWPAGQSLRDRVRILVHQSGARVEQALCQREPPTMIAVRRMEMEDAERIIDLVAGEERARIRQELMDWLVGDIGVRDAGLVNRRRITSEIDRICGEAPLGAMST